MERRIIVGQEDNVSDLSSQHDDILEEGGLQKRRDELVANSLRTMI
jgi:hypothetical protein